MYYNALRLNLPVGVPGESLGNVLSMAGSLVSDTDVQDVVAQLAHRHIWICSDCVFVKHNKY